MLLKLLYRSNCYFLPFSQVLCSPFQHPCGLMVSVLPRQRGGRRDHEETAGCLSLLGGFQCYLNSFLLSSGVCFWLFRCVSQAAALWLLPAACERGPTASPASASPWALVS